MIYELRIYHLNPGKLDEINNRFKNTTFRLFEKHGIHVCDYWETADEQESICYICAFDSREARDNAFEAFRNDPEWIAAYEASHKNGVIVNNVESHFMTRPPYIVPDWK